MGVIDDLLHKEDTERFASLEFAERQNRFYRRWLKDYPVSEYVYLIQAADTPYYYKIGRTINPYDRLTNFDVKLPFELNILALIECRDCVALESTLHTTYAERRVNGEWFLLTGHDIAEIKMRELLEPPPQDRQPCSNDDINEPHQFDFLRLLDMAVYHE